jgi:hypothetical protein
MQRLKVTARRAIRRGDDEVANDRQGLDAIRATACAHHSTRRLKSLVASRKVAVRQPEPAIAQLHSAVIHVIHLAHVLNVTPM